MASKGQAIFTISDADYATMALTMFESVRKFYSDSDLFLFVIGTGSVTKLEGNINVIYISDVLDDLDLSQRLVHYLNVELSTSVRPQCVQHLFAKRYERVIYIDPDILVFRRMTEIDDLLGGNCNGVVTPHALQSISDGELDGGDNVFLRCGIFNMGFFALKNTAETARMLDWWREKLKWKCVVDRHEGYFVDQKWLEFLPVYFDGFHVLRLPTYNLAPWNAEHYELLRDENNCFFIDNFDTPVAFIHFSGIRRMELHFLHMKDARRFYHDKLKKRKFQKLDFTNYEVRHKSSGLLFDKVCTFLYKDYVKKTKDEKSNPLVGRWFYEYLHSTDEETGFPVYIRKLYDIFPHIFVGYLSTKLATNWDNMIWLVGNHFNYDGVVSLETMIQLRNYSQPPNFQIDIHATDKTPYHRAAQSLRKKDRSAPSDREVTFSPDGIEFRSDDIKILIPRLDGYGNLLTDFDAKEYAELWVPSVFCKEKIGREHGIKNVTPILQPVMLPQFEIQGTGIPFDNFVVMLRHDFDMDFAAQDTSASLDAFKEAFGEDSDVRLVCFFINAKLSTEYKNLRSAATARNIMIVDGSDNGYYSYLRRANCFISLHQETEFGYPIAEAMLLGKEVIATACGGNTHYMNPDNSFLVKPDSAMGIVTQAAEFLTEIRDDESLMGIKGDKAKRYVRKHLSPHAIGLAMEKRISDLRNLRARKPIASIPVRAFHKLRRATMRKPLPRKEDEISQQTDAIIKILLRNVIRPDVLE
jgi:glycosyltransferase involved in cell wall biosynthesis